MRLFAVVLIDTEAEQQPGFKPSCTSFCFHSAVSLHAPPGLL